MTVTDHHQSDLLNNGFTTIDHVYSNQEVDQILSVIDQADHGKATFRKSADLFAIRQFLKEIPEVARLVFNERLQTVIHLVLGDNFFVVKSIYFDKPAASNWYVPYHQDLTISVDKKVTLEGFGPWTTKQNQFAVQPPTDLLENLYTIRIHLDDTDENNGALKVLPKSHMKGIYRPETIDWATARETTVNVRRGGIMVMKPLLLHSSSRTTNHQKRRVIHIEFSNQELPAALQWAERLEPTLYARPKV